MNETQKKRLQKYGVIAVSVLLIVYIVYQAYMMIYDPVGTELAYEYTIEDTVDAEVFVARSESYINNSKKGTIISAIEDGSRVSKNQPVAYVFTDTAAADTFTELRDLEVQLERYKVLARQSDNYIFDVEDLDMYVDQEAVKLVDLVNERHFTLLDETINDFRNQVVTKQISTGSKVDFDSRLASLQVKYDTLSKKSTKHTDIVSKNSGYYIGYTDGYENVIDYKEISKIGIDDIRKALEAEPKSVPSGVIGKVVTEFTWYFLSVLEADKVASLSVGNTVTVVLPFSAVNTVEAKVYAMNENKETGEVALILSCSVMNPDAASLRHENAQFVIASHTGIKVPSSAIRVNKDGEKGVYVLSGNIAKFKKINIVYTEDDFILSQAEDGADGYVSLYDNIITEGKDLYDGKVFK